MRIEKKSKPVTATVTATTEKKSDYADAIKYVKAAIDCLGKCDKTDIVAKDNIANLATVMFDLKGSETK